MLYIKENGKITKVHVAASFEEIKRIVGKPNLCASCAVCGCFRNIENEAITLAAKSRDGLFVGECSDYKKGEEKTPIKVKKIQHDGNNAVTLLHPIIRHAFIR